MSTTTKAEKTLPLTLYLKLGSWAALGTSLVAVAALGIMMFFVNSDGQAVYAEAVRAHTITGRALAPAMWIAGTVLLVLVSILAWFGSLYLSARVAGPLFRFSKNLEAAGSGGPLLNIRRDDYLHAISHQLLESVGSLRAHRKRVDELAESAQRCLAEGDLAGFSAAAARMKEEVGHVRLD